MTVSQLDKVKTWNRVINETPNILEAVEAGYDPFEWSPVGPVGPDSDDILGDVNNDGTIDVLDIILVVNFIMDTSNPNNQEIWCSDLNGDTNINIQDIILLINIILESN